MGLVAIRRVSLWADDAQKGGDNMGFLNGPSLMTLGLIIISSVGPTSAAPESRGSLDTQKLEAEVRELMWGKVRFATLVYHRPCDACAWELTSVIPVLNFPGPDKQQCDAMVALSNYAQRIECVEVTSKNRDSLSATSARLLKEECANYPDECR